MNTAHNQGKRYTFAVLTVWKDSELETMGQRINRAYNAHAHAFLFYESRTIDHKLLRRVSCATLDHLLKNRLTTTSQRRIQEPREFWPVKSKCYLLQL
ncbi:hypothetical protein CEXT_306041 [Caerostris extrusa]|uniref:Uncharacterized protein n=1 Tax=Caerostris extrusa TaxID=172846 RepID=A0AAV4V0P1_CAEEX|nr:hypothetical protein CEXT_306041 [Caerostris extrusa]